MKTCAQCQIRYPDALDFCPQDGTALPPTPGRTQALYDALIGTTVDGRYLIEAKLGEGGMGLVYAARHVIIDKRFAIKVLKAEAQEDPTAGQRFIQEAKSASKIRHPNIVDITDFGMMTDGSAYFVMEFLEGHTLGSVIHQGSISPARVIAIAAQVARGLHAAHSNGIIHRDLKPENIFLLEREGNPDSVKIVDFGIAKIQEGGPLGSTSPRLTQIGMVLGTPEYMSPEQATGKETDHRVDEYALGCIMYEMLVGDVPYRGDTSAGTLTKHVFDPLVSPRRKRADLDIPMSLDAVVVKAMAKLPDDRYPGMKELLGALDEAAAEIESGRDAERAAAAAQERGRLTMASSLTTDQLEAVNAAARGKKDRSKSNLGMMVGSAAMVLVVGGVGIALALRGVGNADTEKGKRLETAVVTSAKPDVNSPAAAGPKQVEISLQSNPAGADVYQDNILLGKAPQVIYVQKSGSPIQFTFRKVGYEEENDMVTPDKNQSLEVALSGKHETSPSTRNAKPHVDSRAIKKVGHAKGPEAGSDLRNPFEEDKKKH